MKHSCTARGPDVHNPARAFYCALILFAYAAAATASARAQTAYTWEQVKSRFASANPILKADAISVDEMKAAEITAYLRPNPQFTLSTDGTQLAPHNGIWQPTKGTQLQDNFSYLHEREHKRELRLESAKQGTQIAVSQHEDLKRNLLFNLRVNFVAVLQAKAVLDLTKQQLNYYDNIIDISRHRNQAGGMAQVDLDRIELQRVQYESDWQSAEVNLRTAKIQLQQLLTDRTPVDEFDVQGTFDFSDGLLPLDHYRQAAIEHRPDLQAALQSIDQAKTNHKLAVANGSTDPTFSAWHTYNSSTNNPNANQTIGMNVSIPLRIFDRNQGEKKRTYLDIGRDQQLEDATRLQVFADVDSAHAQVNSSLVLLRPYKEKYLAQATRVRDTVTFAWQRGSASLMDFLNAQSDYRQVELSYTQLIGTYLTTVSQLNLAVGEETVP